MCRWLVYSIGCWRKCNWSAGRTGTCRHGRRTGSGPGGRRTGSGPGGRRTGPSSGGRRTGPGSGGRRTGPSSGGRRTSPGPGSGRTRSGPGSRRTGPSPGDRRTGPDGSTGSRRRRFCSNRRRWCRYITSWRNKRRQCSDCRTDYRWHEYSWTGSFQKWCSGIRREQRQQKCYSEGCWCSTQISKGKSWHYRYYDCCGWRRIWWRYQYLLGIGQNSGFI